MKDWIKSLPQYVVHDYELGKHWPETGDYKEWLAKKIADFQRNYVYFSHDTFSTNSGGTILLAKGMTKKQYEHIASGGCFICTQTFTKPEELANHLSDKHCWTEQAAMDWLREVIQEEAFSDEP